MNILDLIGNFSNVAGCATVVITGVLWYTDKVKTERSKDLITILLKNKEDTFECPLKISRGAFSRAEVLGLLGMIPRKERFITISSMGTQQYLNDIEKIRVGLSSTLIIQCVEEDLLNFDAYREMKGL